MICSQSRPACQVFAELDRTDMKGALHWFAVSLLFYAHEKEIVGVTMFVKCFVKVIQNVIKVNLKFWHIYAYNLYKYCFCNELAIIYDLWMVVYKMFLSDDYQDSNAVKKYCFYTFYRQLINWLL